MFRFGRLPVEIRHPWRRVVCSAFVVAFTVVAPGAIRTGAEELQFDVPGPIPLLAFEHGRDLAAVVLIQDGQLSPARVAISEDTRIAWRSAAPEAMRISFARDVARAMLCTSVVNFASEGGRLRSARLLTGETAHFCHLKPGIYRYRVERDGQSLRRGSLSQRLEGTVIVSARDVAAR